MTCCAPPARQTSRRSRTEVHVGAAPFYVGGPDAGRCAHHSDGDLAPTVGPTMCCSTSAAGRWPSSRPRSTAIQPYTAKQQALPYAKQIGAPFIFLTNGELIYFWDYRNDDARIVNSFFSRRDLERLVRDARHAQAARDNCRSRSITSARARPVRCVPTSRRPCRRSTTRSSWASAAS